MDLHWWYWDVVGWKLIISPQLRNLLGYTEEEFDPKLPTLDKNIHPEDAASNLKAFRDLVAGKSEFYEQEYRLKVEGEWRWYYNRGNIVSRDNKGNPLFIAGVTMDMSGRFDNMIRRLEEGEKFEFVYRNTNQPVFIVDYTERKEPGVLLDMNDAAKNILSMDIEEYLAKDINNLLDRILNTEKKTLNEELSREGKVKFETVYLDSLGVEKYLEVNAHTFTLTGKNLLMAIVNDKSESQLVKRDLKSSEMMFKSIFDNSTSGIMILDLEGKIEHMNPIALELTGNSQSDIATKHLSKLLQIDKKEVGIYLGEIARGEKPSVIFEHYCKFSRNNIWFWLTLSGVRDEAGNLEYFLLMLEDISGRKEMEDALRDSENLYKQLIQSADDRIGLFDLEGNILILNTAYYRTLGFTHEEYAKLDEIDRFHPDDRESIDKAQENFFDTGLQSVEYRIMHKDGHYMHMSANIVLLRGEDGGKDYILNMIRDVSPQKKFQKELVDAKERAEESDLLKSAFLANMSHEIRTPMNSIVGFSNLLADSNLDIDSRSEYVKRVNKNSDQLLTLISDIIDLSKIESNQLTISFSPIKLSTLFNDVLHYGELQLSSRSKKGLELEYDPDPKNPELFMESDLVRLTQILQNLVNNAIKFTQEGVVTAGYRRIDDDTVRLFVNDTGVGIDSHNFDIIFDQFRQIDGSHTRKYGGTGLGLAICRNLVRMLGGNIWVESVKGEGATFIIELPLSGEFGPVHVAHYQKSERRIAQDDITILIVDDDDDSLNLLATLLKTEGIKAISADSGYAALQFMESGNLPNMVFMDLQMPVLNGKHTMEIIKDLYPNIKVIAQSAHAIDGDKQKFINMGFDDYFAKPFRKNEILDVIARNSIN